MHDEGVIKVVGLFLIVWLNAANIMRRATRERMNENTNRFLEKKHKEEIAKISVRRYYSMVCKEGEIVCFYHVDLAYQ